MNVRLQICGLLIALFLLVIYTTQKKLGLVSERIFSLMLYLVILCISLDILSVFAIRNSSSIPKLLMDISCKAYLISMIWVGWINFCYIALDLNSTSKGYKLTVKRMVVATVVFSVIIAVLPISVFDDGAELYSYGPAVVATYVFTLFYIVSTMAMSIYIAKTKNVRRGIAVALTTTVWVIAAIIQALHNELLVVGFSMAAGVMVLYIVMENPDSNLDRTLGCFNSYALNSYLTKMLDSGKIFGIVDVSITDPNSIKDKGINLEKISRKAINELVADEDLKIFKNYGTGILAVTDNEKAIRHVTDLIMKLVTKYNASSSSVLLFVINNVEQFNSTEDINKFMTFIRGKSAGRLSTIVRVSQETIKQYRDNQRIEKEINLALVEDRVEVFLQPICNAKTGAVESAESLVRIRNKDGSLLPPGLFIPIAETTGQINELGERVLEKVCEFLRDSEVKELGVTSIHVNLSAIQCDDNSTARKLSAIVDRYQVDPSYISFEITETAVSTAKDILLENMNALVSKGYRFALDDFGKGESNLMYIVEMPVDILKLDMDMSKAYFANPKAKVVVGAVSDMASKLDLPIVAEGIESKEEADEISSRGIKYIQGYYYSRPLPMKEFIEYLKQKGNKLAVESIIKKEEKKEFVKIDVVGKRILLVEDNEMNAELAQEILEDNGFEIDLAKDGIEAVDKVINSEHGYYSLVLMDIRMPLMDGYEATRRIRELDDKELANIPIIALTSQDSEEDRNKAFEAGMNEHIVKPISYDHLMKLINLK